MEETGRGIAAGIEGIGTVGIETTATRTGTDGKGRGDSWQFRPLCGRMGALGPSCCHRRYPPSTYRVWPFT
jgi:hypothetical protein